MAALRKLAVAAVAAFSVAGLGFGIAWAASQTTGTSVSCATATLPAHTVGVDGAAVDTIAGTSTVACNTVTYTIPTVTQTVTASTSATSTSTSSTASTTTSATSTGPPTSGAVVPAAPTGPAIPTGGWRVEYADAFGSCLSDTSAKCSLGAAHTDTTLGPVTHANGPGNSNGIAAWEPAYNDITADGLDMECRAVPNLGDSYSCGALSGGQWGASAPKAFRWSPGPSTHIVIQFSIKLPPNEGNMDPGIWATGQTSSTPYAWEIDFPEWWGWNHYPTTSNTWCGDGLGFPAVPRDINGPTGEIAKYFCQSGGPQFDPSAAFHTYTLDENGDTLTAYIDGAEFGSRTYSGLNTAAGELILQNAMRSDNATGLRTDPHFPAGGNDTLLRYIAVFEPASANNAATNGPVVAPGTTIQATG